MPGIVGNYLIGVGGIAALALALTSAWPHGHHELIAILAAALAASHMIVYLVLHPRQMRTKVAKALRVNSVTGGLPEP